jgi:hypothetical protein
VRRARRALTAVSWALLWGLAAVSCEQEDLVARARVAVITCEERGDCPPEAGSIDAGRDADMAPEPECKATACASRSRSRDALCNGSGPLAQLGDGCSDDARRALSFRYALCACTGLATASPFEIDGAGARIAVNGDAAIGEGARIAGDIELQGSLIGSAKPTGQLIEHGPPRCGCPPALEPLDVKAAVDARASDNDNGDLPVGMFAGIAGTRALELACGRFYFSRISGSGAVQIKASGNVAIYIGANVELTGDLIIEPDGPTQVSLFIAGNVLVTGRVQLASPDGALNVRMVVGGDGTVNLRGDVVMNGLVYAPRAELVSDGRFELNGALFAERVNPNRELIIHYDASLGDPAAQRCGTP